MTANAQDTAISFTMNVSVGALQALFNGGDSGLADVMRAMAAEQPGEVDTSTDQAGEDGTLTVTQQKLYQVVNQARRLIRVSKESTDLIQSKRGRNEQRRARNLLKRAIKALKAEVPEGALSPDNNESDPAFNI